MKIILNNDAFDIMMAIKKPSQETKPLVRIAAEEEQPLHAVLVSRVDRIRRDREVHRQKLRRIGAVGVDPTDFRRRDDRRIGRAQRRRCGGLSARRHRVLVRRAGGVSDRCRVLGRRVR